MKKVLLSLFSCVLFTILQAQTPCEGVTAEVTYPSPQGGSYNVFGVKVTLAQPYNQPVTVIGVIYEDGNGPSGGTEWTLTIVPGETIAETANNAYQFGPASMAAVQINSVSPCPTFVTMTTDLQNYLSQKQQELNNVGSNIYLQVNMITSDVTANADGTLTYPNYVRLVEIGEAIDSLNGVWDDIYASVMNDIVTYAFTSGAATGLNNEENREKVWDIIEDNYFIIPENKATLSLEQKFGFTSLHSQITNAENVWLNNGGIDMSQNPALNQNLPEEFWSVVTPSYGVQITDMDVSNQLLSMQDTARAQKLLGTIKEIVDIIGKLIDGIDKLSQMLKDCSGSTEAKVRHIRNGIYFDNDKKMIGYEIEQKSITFDFNSSETKIKGKAKLFKIKDSGNKKRDRKNNVGIYFCTKQWDACDEKEWPSDGGSYIHPTNTQKKKVKTYMRQPYALAIEKSYHYLAFHFFGLDQYVGSVNLLGTDGCF